MGMLLAALGGAAEQGIDVINKRQAIDAQNERDENLKRLRSKLSIEREATIEAVRLQHQADLHNQQQQRLSDQNAVIEREAADTRSAKDVDTANKVAPSVDGAVMDFIKTTLPPEKVREVYGVQEATPVTQLDDQIAAARQRGFYESANGLRADRRVALSELNANRREDDRAMRTVLLEQRIDGNQDMAERRLKQQGSRTGAGHEPAVVGTFRYLKKLGWTDERIERFLTSKKATSATELEAKLSRGNKADRPPRQSLEGTGASMDADGNLRDGQGRIFKKSTRPGVQDAQPEVVNTDVADFNRRMAMQPKPERTLIDRLFNLGAGK